jgi:hypothetical protein
MAREASGTTFRLHRDAPWRIP